MTSDFGYALEYSFSDFDCDAKKFLPVSTPT
jgi:hypothetical protein